MNNFQSNSYQVDASVQEERQKVLRSTYLLLALSLIPTAIGALLGINMSFMFMMRSPILAPIVLIASMYFLMYLVQRNKDSFAGVVWMMAFTFFMGLLLGPLLQFALRVPNGSSLILLAALLTSVVFFVMSAIAYTVKRELSFLSSFLTIGAIVLMVAVVANIFLRMPGLYLMICGAFVIFSSLMILWQVNQVVRGGETNYISATLTLYISIYNLFTSLLQIILAFSGNDRR
ncbi:MAG: Bax inhibitor-1/YccA family protein [Proteobacteria bacterium]|jgi:modulator of FtsH protease|nr:Bax inhibitor-1/YccA family protein [Pseudomonadota bacterium]